jgi:hypothetical protein
VSLSSLNGATQVPDSTGILQPSISLPYRAVYRDRAVPWSVSRHHGCTLQIP